MMVPEEPPLVDVRLEELELTAVVLVTESVVVVGYTIMPFWQ